MESRPRRGDSAEAAIRDAASAARESIVHQEAGDGSPESAHDE